MTQPTARPHVAALVAALAAHRGTVAARLPQAGTADVTRELEDFVTRERTTLSALAAATGRAGDLLEDDGRGSRSPVAAVTAAATAFVPLDQALLTDVAVVRAIADRAHVAHVAEAAHGSGADSRALVDALHEAESFHREWAEWQLAAAGEFAAGGAGRLQPTAAQRAA
ncbi:hypothetical protein ACXR2U_23300, partial [Jatrophihabitans sp. YIM 134969]